MQEEDRAVGLGQLQMQCVEPRARHLDPAFLHVRADVEAVVGGQRLRLQQQRFLLPPRQRDDGGASQCDGSGRKGEAA